MASFAGLKADIGRELRNIDRLTAELDTVIASTDEQLPTRVRAAGSVLHDFYTAVEKIFQRIGAAVDRDLPTGDDWHVQLLERMATPVEEIRPAVIDEPLAERLEEYMRFRHVFRHMYGFELKWERCKPLADGLPETASEFRRQMEGFREFLGVLGDS